MAGLPDDLVRVLVDDCLMTREDVSRSWQWRICHWARKHHVRGIW
jgi:hypothetical protein